MAKITFNKEDEDSTSVQVSEKPAEPITKSPTLTLVEKALSSAEACARLRKEGYDESKHEALVRKSFSDLSSLGFKPVLLERASKSPGTVKDWQNQVREKEDFKGYSNIGILTGVMGDGVCDIDIDIPEMIDVLPQFLPPTPFRFGRFYGTGTQRIAHWLYRVTDSQGGSFNENGPPPALKGAKTPSVEVRTGDGGSQTMAPGSVIVDHKRGYIIDCVRWVGNTMTLPKGELPVTTEKELRLCVKVALASYYSVEHFKSGKFHEDMMYWCGFLMCAGVPNDLVEKSIKYIVRASGQTDEYDRLNAITTTQSHIDKSGSAAGIGYLRDSDRWSKKLCKWLSKLLKYGGEGELDERPAVRIISSHEPKWADLTIDAMAKTEKFYQMSGQTCVVTKNEGSAVIVPLDKSVNAASWLTREIRFTQSVIDKATGVMTDHDIKCPTSLALEIADPSTYKGTLPVLVGVSNTPLITPTGKIIQDTWGYDADLKLFFSSEFSVRNMYRDEAIPLLEDLLSDFPFVSPRYRASAMSAILTAGIRPVLDICPMYVITSSQYSDGKSVLSGLIAASAGVETSIGQLSRGGNDEEQEKQLSAILSRGRRVVTLDNHDGEFRSPSLTETLTSTNPEFRILGKNETRSVPNKTMFLLNGVNTSPALDLQTRSVFIRLARTTVDPSRKFKHMDIVGYTFGKRGDIISAGISLIKWAMEQPDGNWKPTHRFKTWDRMVRRTIMLTMNIDIAPPVSEDTDRTIDSTEESRYNFLEFALGLWHSGVRNKLSKSGNYFAASDIAQNIGPDSEEEAWVTILSKRPRNDLTTRCGYALNSVKELPFLDKSGETTWRLIGYSVNGKSAYRFEEI